METVWPDAPTVSLLAAAAVIAARAVRVRVRRRPHPMAVVARPAAAVWPRVGRGLSVLGFALALSWTPTPAQGQSVSSPRPSRHAPAPPWSRASGSPPPRPLARPGAAPDAAPSEEAAPPSTEDGERRLHPAVHPEPSVRRGPITPLFPRETRRPDAAPAVVTDRSENAVDAERAARLDAIRRHPAGKGLARRAEGCTRGTYTVRVGDTLWDIAGRVLATDDPRRIAAYWPKLHRANRDVVGRDPNLILPGQILRLPNEC